MGHSMDENTSSQYKNIPQEKVFRPHHTKTTLWSICQGELCVELESFCNFRLLKPVAFVGKDRKNVWLLTDWVQLHVSCSGTIAA